MNARAFIGVEILDREAPIVDAACDHDGPSTDAFATGELQNKTRGLIVKRLETDHLVGYCGLDPELRRLVISARHQRHSTDAGRKAEVILDARRCAGLAAERTVVQRQNRKSLRCCVDGSGKACRSSSDDGDIIEPVWIDRAD